MYDGFIEYFKSFMFNKSIDEAIVKECRARLHDMRADLETFHGGDTTGIRNPEIISEITD